MSAARRSFKIGAGLLTTVVLMTVLLSNPAIADSKPGIDWYALLRLSEQQLDQNKFLEGTNNYIKALQAAETTKISCGEPRFVELMSLASEIVARGGKRPTPTSPPSVATTNKLIETALKSKEHAASAVCGQDSAPVIESWQSLSVFYSLVSNDSLSRAYQKKCLAPSAVDKFPEVQIYTRAGSARSSVYMHKEFSSLKSELNTLKKVNP